MKTLPRRGGSASRADRTGTSPPASVVRVPGVRPRSNLAAWPRESGRACPGFEGSEPGRIAAPAGHPGRLPAIRFASGGLSPLIVIVTLGISSRTGAQSRGAARRPSDNVADVCLAAELSIPGRSRAYNRWYQSPVRPRRAASCPFTTGPVLMRSCSMLSTTTGSRTCLARCTLAAPWHEHHAKEGECLKRSSGGCIQPHAKLCQPVGCAALTHPTSGSARPSGTIPITADRPRVR